jgi:hypothetical protein
VNLPIYKCIIDENVDSPVEVEFMALVDKPAIEKNFMAFKGQLKFNLDEDKRIVSGPAMLADMLIYRNDDKLGEYYTTFDKTSISNIVQKFFKKGYIKNFNLMHDANQKTSDVTIFESFITDEARGIKPMKGFEDAKDGSWFISAKVDNEEIWNKIKAGEIKGFSVEGMFNQVPVQMSKITPEVAMEKIKQILNSVTL